MRNKEPVQPDNLLVSDQPAETIVGASLKVQGDLKSDGDIRIDGEVQGSIITKGSVFIGQQASVEASIQAGSAQICGKVAGDISVSKKLELQPSARLKGNISAAELVIQQGAQFNGSSSMTGAEALDKITTTLSTTKQTALAT
ncbi:MAG: polymer-forming cytoskeletal protein [bacterium]|nr:polymer-forming cytoskeletal protein [bacterium]